MAQQMDFFSGFLKNKAPNIEELGCFSNPIWNAKFLLNVSDNIINNVTNLKISSLAISIDPENKSRLDSFHELFPNLTRLQLHIRSYNFMDFIISCSSIEKLQRLEIWRSHEVGRYLQMSYFVANLLSSLKNIPFLTRNTVFFFVYYLNQGIFLKSQVT